MFNAHAPNLREGGGTAAATNQLKLGQEKKASPPVISVRPFVQRDQPLPSKINMVSPMINGELVKSSLSSSSTTSSTTTAAGATGKKTGDSHSSSNAVKARENSSGKGSVLRDNSSGNLIVRKLSQDGSGRGEVKPVKSYGLGSDGSTENSSDSDSNMRDSPPPVHPSNNNNNINSHHVTGFSSATTVIREPTADQQNQQRDTTSPVKQTNFHVPGQYSSPNSSQDDTDKKPPTNATSSSTSTPTTTATTVGRLSKTLFSESRGPAKLSLSVHASSPASSASSQINNPPPTADRRRNAARRLSNIEPMVLGQTVARNSTAAAAAAAARLSFLSCTVNGGGCDDGMDGEAEVENNEQSDPDMSEHKTKPPVPTLPSSPPSPFSPSTTHSSSDNEIRVDSITGSSSQAGPSLSQQQQEPKKSGRTGSHEEEEREKVDEGDEVNTTRGGCVQQTKVTTQGIINQPTTNAPSAKSPAAAVQPTDGPAPKVILHPREPVKEASPKDPPKVKLTRNSPYVLGRNGSTAILKGTPKPIITRKPAILKDKPKVPLKPNKLVGQHQLRSPSLSPAPPPPAIPTSDHHQQQQQQQEKQQQSQADTSSPAPQPNHSASSSAANEEATTANSRNNNNPPSTSSPPRRRVSNLVRKGGPVAAPRTSSFRQRTELAQLSLAPAPEDESDLDGFTFSNTKKDIIINDDAEEEGRISVDTLLKGPSAPADRNSLIIAVSSGEADRTASSDTDTSVTTSPPYNNKHIATIDGAGENSSTATGGGGDESKAAAALDCVNQDIRPKTATSPTNPASPASPPQVVKKLADKNKEALEAIRKSLSNKLISGAPPQRVVESIKASSGGLESLTQKTPVQKRVSNSFEETRAALEESLHFSRHEKSATPLNNNIGKRQAPEPPPAAQEEEQNSQRQSDAPDTVPEQQEAGREEVVVEAAEDKQPEAEAAATAVPEVPATPKLTPAIRNSSMKSEMSTSNKPAKLRTVQFSPDTMTVTVPAVDRNPKTISYNRWMGRNPYHLESSFTGQPIAMLPPGAINPGSAKKPPVVAYPSPPVVDDAPRKWTEKKKKWRSRSTPRSSEIDELMGSSKTKAPTRLALFTPGSPGPVKRQSRVEIYESEKKVVAKNKGKFSLKNLFRAGTDLQSPEPSPLPNKFIDKVCSFLAHPMQSS